TSHFCRPIALLLGSGFSFAGFRLAQPAPAPVAVETAWLAKQAFTPQKHVAMSRAKCIVVTGAAAMVVGFITLIAGLYFR
ncbi:MAG: hypothetical protein KDA51_04150, partial [Planctomycetales bacterium]|nr:hypothetical protein [Planctomycetales bacterium]